MTENQITWGIVWAAVALIMAFIFGIDADSKIRFAMTCAVALVWPVAVAAVVVTFVVFVVACGLCGFYLWGKLALLELRRLRTRRGDNV